MNTNTKNYSHLSFHDYNKILKNTIYMSDLNIGLKYISSDFPNKTITTEPINHPIQSYVNKNNLKELIETMHIHGFCMNDEYRLENLGVKDGKLIIVNVDTMIENRNFYDEEYYSKTKFTYIDQLIKFEKKIYELYPTVPTIRKNQLEVLSKEDINRLNSENKERFPFVNRYKFENMVVHTDKKYPDVQPTNIVSGELMEINSPYAIYFRMIYNGQYHFHDEFYFKEKLPDDLKVWFLALPVDREKLSNKICSFINEVISNNRITLTEKENKDLFNKSLVLAYINYFFNKFNDDDKKELIKIKESFEIKDINKYFIEYMENLNDYIHLNKASNDIPNNIKVCEFVCRSYNTDCSYHGFQISNALIKVASTRIFAEPEQSIMELPVNSIDSYSQMNGKHTVGKFGMGFFSIIYWLVDKQSRFLNILSRTKEDSFFIELTWKNNELNFNNRGNAIIPLINNIAINYISTVNPNSGYNEIFKYQNHTGTFIDLDCSKNPLTHDNILSIKTHLYRLFQIKNGNIYIVDLDNNKPNIEIINKTRYDINNGNVLIFISVNGIKIMDNASGISKDTLYKSLLVPSSSTKKRNIAFLEDVDLPYIMNDGASTSLYIIVNGVTIVSINLKTKGPRYIINLPTNSKLPVSRDDIIYEKYESNYFEQQVNTLIEEHESIIDIFSLLDEYTKRNTQQTLFECVLRIKNKLSNRTDVIFIPDKPIYHIIKRNFQDIKFIFHPHPELYRTEEQLSKLLDPISSKDIFWMKNVVFFDFGNELEMFESGGLSKYIFVNTRYSNKHEQYISNIITQTDKTLLFPADVKYNIGFFKGCYYEDDKCIENKLLLNEDFVLMLNTVLMTLEGKTQNLSIDDIFSIKFKNKLTYKKKILFTYGNLFYSINKDIPKTLKILQTFNSKISEIKFDFTYGEDGNINFNITHMTPISSSVKHNSNKELNETQKNILIEISYNLMYFYIDVMNENCNRSGGSYWFPNFKYFYPMKLGIENLDDKFKHEIFEGLSKCKTSEEYFIFLKMMNIFISNLAVSTLKDLDGLHSHLLLEIRRSMPNIELYKIIKEYVTPYSGNNFELYIQNPIQNSLNLYYSIMNNSYIRDKNLDTIGGNTFTFSTKSLIQYVYTHTIDDNLTRLLNVLNHDYKTFNYENTKLQIVEIAVNEGTTKTFIQSVLTETIQNSIDAIRTTKSIDKIDIIIDDESVSVKDYVGFDNIKVFLALLIPFYSSKDTNDPNVTGEMGTGFFNVFRQPWTQSVKINTSLNGISTNIIAIPIVKNNLVHDVEYIVTRAKTNQENHTEIIIILNDDLEMRTQTLTDAKLFVNNFIGLIPGITFTLNGELKEKHNEIVYETEIGTVIYTNVIITESYVFTNGVPFITLNKFINNFDGIITNFSKFCSNQMIINFKKNLYTPSQSRTNINISNENKIKLIKFLNNAMYIVCLTKYINKIYSNEIIYGTLSTTNIHQLYIFGVSKEAFEIYKLDKNVNVKDKFKSIVDSVPKNKLTLKYMLSKLDDKNIVDKAIIRYISNKDFKNKEENSKNGIEIIITDFTELQPFINIYWDILKKLTDNNTIKLTNKINTVPPTLKIGNINDGVLGYYNKGNNIVVLNSYNYNRNKIVDKIKYFKLKYKLTPKEVACEMRMDDTMKEIFNPCIPCTTLIHELCHAVLSEEHEGNSHGQTTAKIDGEFLMFEDLASSIYKLMVENNIFDRFFNS
jgi:hypothetical protein